MSGEFRVGLGYDVHRLSAGRRLVLGGVEIPHTHGLDGHSDADVILHALTDSILGAAGLPDIGTLFPNSDPALKDADSSIFLVEAVRRAAEKGFRIANCDCAVIAERPKLAPFVSQMKSRIATILGIEAEAVGIKATTGEGLGFTGRGEGIAAHAVVLLARDS